MRIVRGFIEKIVRKFSGYAEHSKVSNTIAGRLLDLRIDHSKLERRTGERINSTEDRLDMIENRMSGVMSLLEHSVRVVATGEPATIVTVLTQDMYNLSKTNEEMIATFRKVTLIDSEGNKYNADEIERIGVVYDEV